ncbi:Abnormal spindle-like microcephaly-associated-like protein isoform X2 [Oopsacas minuta]|uniref:Abnormal spindle-like microcephaly-associated-like protein isoform X2 n=1 Tax=Oopsacas minuta TaxID=111878 RepID=A0AAV7KGQ8_9METZ|nr:Abnormal spindle-like microcephaly-associated-like protein isoform X2 [Oopsacas minuta]
MSSTYSQAQLKTPKGFEHLLESLCKEVLRRQPENILEYATEHFTRLMKLREETGYDGYTPKAEKELAAEGDTVADTETDLVETPQAEVEQQGDEAVVEVPNGEEQLAEERETQDDAPEAEQTAVTADSVKDDKPESDKEDIVGSLPEADTTEPVVDEDKGEGVKDIQDGSDTEGTAEGAPADGSDTEGTAEGAPAEVTQKPQDTSDKEVEKEDSPEASADNTELPASDEDTN